MKILITGSNGFIGRNIKEYLAKKDYNVIGCGRKKTSVEKDKYVSCDLAQNLPNVQVDIIIHAAAQSPAEDANFSDYFNNNIIATKNLLQYAKENNIKRIIYLGAVSSYGNVDGMLEENSPHNNPSPYGLTKYVAEELIRRETIPHYILILPGVVGNGCRDNWIMNVIRTLYKGENLIYYNREGLFNNILDINDLCIFIEKLIKKDCTESETYLLGTRDIMKVEEIILYLKKKLLSDSVLIEKNEKSKSFFLNVNKAEKAGFVSDSMINILDKACEEIKGEKNKYE